MKLSPALILILVLPLLFGAGCAEHGIKLKNELFPPQPLIALSPGDELDIRVQGNAVDYNTIQKVRPDGKISVAGLNAPNELAVAGLTPDEVDAKLTELYKIEIANPVTVIVNSYAQQRVFVEGAVKLPGVILMPGQLTVLQAIISAGGFEMISADRKRVVVFRQKGDQRFAKVVNVDRMLKSDVSSTDIALGPNDIVWVPRTGVYRTNQWIRQYITNNVPFVNVLGAAVVP